MANNCNTPSLYKSLKFCPGTTVLPGVRGTMYVIAKRDIVQWPTRKKVTDSAATINSIATYEGNFVLAADKKWLRIDLTHNKGNIECETQGNPPSRYFLNKFTAEYSSTDAVASGFLSLAHHDDLVALVQQRDGSFRVIGCEAFPADIKSKLSTGEGMETAGGSSISFEAPDSTVAPFYNGNIVTEDGTLQP